MQALGYNIPQLQTATLNIPNPSDPNTIKQFQQSPGYNYELQQSSNAIQNSAAGKTGAISGNMLNALQGNAVGLASQDYWNWFNAADQYGLQNFNAQTQNYMNQYSTADADYWKLFGAEQQGNTQSLNALLQMAGMGQSAAANQGLTTLGGNIGQAQIGQGNALAGGQIGGANALTTGIGNALFNPYLMQLLQGNNNQSAYGQPYSYGGGPGNWGNSSQGDWSSGY